MTSSTSIIDIASFGTYPAYLAARLDGLKTTLGLNQLEVYGTNARFVEGDGDGDKTVGIGPIGHVVNLTLGALRESPVELWDYETWVEMSAVATCSLDVRMAESLRIEYKPLPADAKRIVDKLNATVGGDAPERAARAHNKNQAGDLDAETRGEPRPQAAGARSGRQAAVAATAAASAATVAAGAARNRAARLRSAARDRTAEGPAGRYTATLTTAERIRAA